MAETVIKHSDIIAEKVFQPTIDQSTLLLSQLIKLESGLKVVLKTSEKFFKSGTPKNTEELDKFAKKLKETDNASKGLDATQKVIKKTEEQLKQVRTAAALQLAKEKKEISELNFITKQQAIIKTELSGSVIKLRAQLALITLEWNKSNAAQREAARADGSLSKQKLDLTNKLKELEKATGDTRRNVGNYKESITEALKESGLFGQATEKVNKIANITTGIYSVLKLAQDKVTGALGFGKVATEAKTISEEKNIVATGISTTATIANTVAEKTNTAATETAIVVEKTQKAALEGTTTAATAATAATSGLTKALDFLKAHPVIAALSILAAAGIAVGTAIASSNQKVVDALEKTLAGLKAASFGAVGAKEAMDKFKDTLFASRDILRELHSELQRVSLDEQDQNEIITDGTIGFQERNIALSKSISLSNERAKIGVKIAQTEFDVSEKELEAQKLLAHGEDALKEFVDKHHEALLRLNIALDIQGDLLRQNDVKQRQLNESRTFESVDLILKKKQSANAEKIILENQLADEKNQLEERKIIADKLLTVNKETTAEQIKLIKRGLKIEFDEKALIGEQDAVLLKEKLDGIKQIIINEKGVRVEAGLGDAAKTELAKIIKQAQENEIENNKQLAKLEEEAIIRRQKIAEITRDISRLQQEDIVHDTEIFLSEKIAAFEKSNEALLKGDESVNQELRKARDKDFIDAKELIIQSGIEKEELLKITAISEKKKIEENTKDKIIAAAEIKKIDEKLTIDKINLQDETNKKTNILEDKNTESIKAAEIQKAKIIQDIEAEITKGKVDELQRRVDKEKSATKINIQEIGKVIDEQTDIRKEQLQSQAFFEINLADKTHEQKLLIEQKLKNDLAKIDDDALKAKEDLAKAEIDLNKKIRQQILDDTFKTLDTVNNAIREGLQKRSQAEQEEIGKAQTQNEAAITRQEELAAKGLTNQLAFEEQKKAQLALKLKEEKQKEREQEDAVQLAAAFFEFLKERAKENPNTAPARALADVLIAKSISKSIAGLYEGTESVSEEHSAGTLPRSKDNLLVPLHKGERVVGYEDSKRIKGLSNEELVRAGELYKSGFYMPEISDVSKKKEVENTMNAILIKEVRQLNTTLKNKKENHFKINELGDWVLTEIENNNKKIITYSRSNKPSRI